MMSRLLASQRTRLLPAAEQIRLAAEFHHSRSAAIERRLIEANLRLVVKIARQLDRSRGRFLDDLVQEGCLGLVEGIRRFDPAKGARLATYAAFWIRAFIMKYLMDNVSIVRTVRTRMQRADFFGGTFGSVDVSFDAERDAGGQASGEAGATPLRERIADPRLGADRLLEQAQLRADLGRAADCLEQRLSARDAVVLRERVLAEEPAPRGAIARRASVTCSRIGQIETRLRAALRERLSPAWASLAA